MDLRGRIVTLGLIFVLIAAAAPAGAADFGLQTKENSSPPRAGAQRLLSRAELLARIRQLDPAFPDDLTPTGGIGCQIEDAFGNRVATVSALNQSGEPAAWLQYLNDGEVDHQVRFVVVPAFAGSPLLGQTQLFQTDDACNVVTPFGIPFWGGDRTSGPWRLAIRNDRGGVAICGFDVVP